MNERFRSRVFKQAMEESTRCFEDFDQLFEEILGNHALGKRLKEFLKNLSQRNKRQGLRFLELCYREDEPKYWANFLKHEQARVGSPWREREGQDEDDVVKLFAEQLPLWWTDTSQESYVNQKFENYLAEWQRIPTGLTEIEDLLGGFEPTTEEYKEWRLTLLRQVMQKIIRGDVA